ncbi:arylamine N-acetyltransferase [Phenylobacterium sp.]|uniref:arylamine N-acetyltransferase family protein n=1 Tax=Phenylobacterium sp. TaxID=1871053 RepID=UPI00271893DC|nr:arylamine N-acetyltransferase [Phenylobacterium sp.]MDO8378865.1 arylamine N-acetyltransferase [Phenylobacterium sp.]
MDLSAYLARIGYAGTPRVDLPTLHDLHRRHLQAIPYENLDVQLGRPGGVDIEDAYDKIVTRRRGGWCYEMNGLFGWALREIGFDVTRMAGAVGRDERGAISHGNHLVLRVDLDRPYLADVGFGDGMLEPIPLLAGGYSRAGYDFRLEQVDADWWRLHNHALGGAPYFDFTLETAREEALAATCQWLRTAPESVFTQFPIVQRHTRDGLVIILGRTLRRIRPGERTQALIDTADQFVEVLARDFGLDVPEMRSLWPAICAKHEELFGEKPD